MGVTIKKIIITQVSYNNMSPTSLRNNNYSYKLVVLTPQKIKISKLKKIKALVGKVMWRLRVYPRPRKADSVNDYLNKCTQGVTIAVS